MGAPPKLRKFYRARVPRQDPSPRAVAPKPSLWRRGSVPPPRTSLPPVGPARRRLEAILAGYAGDRAWADPAHRVVSRICWTLVDGNDGDGLGRASPRAVLHYRVVLGRLNSRCRTRRRDAGTPRAGLRADLPRSGRGPLHAPPRHASRRRRRQLRTPPRPGPAFPLSFLPARRLRPR